MLWNWNVSQMKRGGFVSDDLKSGKQCSEAVKKAN